MIYFAKRNLLSPRGRQGCVSQRSLLKNYDMKICKKTIINLLLLVPMLNLATMILYGGYEFFTKPLADYFPDDVEKVFHFTLFSVFWSIGTSLYSILYLFNYFAVLAQWLMRRPATSGTRVRFSHTAQESHEGLEWFKLFKTKRNRLTRRGILLYGVRRPVDEVGSLWSCYS